MPAPPQGFYIFDVGPGSPRITEFQDPTLHNEQKLMGLSETGASKELNLVRTFRLPHAGQRAQQVWGWGSPHAGQRTEQACGGGTEPSALTFDKAHPPILDHRAHESIRNNRGLTGEDTGQRQWQGRLWLPVPLCMSSSSFPLRAPAFSHTHHLASRSEEGGQSHRFHTYLKTHGGACLSLGAGQG